MNLAELAENKDVVKPFGEVDVLLYWIVEGKLVELISRMDELERNGLRVSGGHGKLAGVVAIDPSQTPSGKLARAPFSLHTEDYETINGVAIPLEIDVLEDKKLVGELKEYAPNRVVEGPNSLSKRLP